MQPLSFLDLNFSFFANFNTSNFIDELNIHNYFFYQTHFPVYKIQFFITYQLEGLSTITLVIQDLAIFGANTPDATLKKKGKQKF